MKKEWLIFNKGFLLTEVLLSSAIFIGIVTAFAGVYFYGQESTLSAGNRTRAVILANEGLEAMRNIRDSGFSNLPVGTHGLVLSGNQWVLSGSQDITGIFTRQVVVSLIDANRKNVNVNVTWQQNPQIISSVSLSTRVTNWIAMGTSGGGGGYGTGDWSAPIITSSSTTLVGSDHGGEKIQVQGNYVYIITREGKDFFIVDVSTSTAPVVKGSLTLAGTLKNLFVFGDYVYIVSDDNAKELQIVDVTNKNSPSLVGTYNAPGNGDAQGVYVVDNTAYIVRSNGSDDEFIAINVTNRSSPTFTGSLNLGGTAYELVVSGNYAYVATEKNNEELQIVNITNQARPIIAGSLALSANEINRSMSVALAGSKLYISEGDVLYLVNVSVETSPILSSFVTFTGFLNDVAINLGKNDTYIYLATSEPSKELKIYNVASSTAPFLVGSYDLTGTNPLYGIAYNPVVDRAYAVSNSTTASLIIFAPKP